MNRFGPLRDRVGAIDRRTRLAFLGAVTALLVWTLSTTVFPYHSVNHDEAVYLQQAAMLLEGQLYLQPPVEEAFRPWFFVDSAQGLYPKYSPVPAAMFAVGELLGGYRIALALTAAGVVVLTQRVVALTFDELTGYVAAIVLLASPLFLVQSSVFLPYVPTMLWNLAFAVAYLKADEEGNRRWAALAGLAAGIAFFARPYTAVLFATPFIIHALWTMRGLERPVILRQTTTAAFGLLGVVTALAYNTVVTGDPMTFPYQAFAPLDGLGFGRRELLGYAVEYTPELGLRSNAEAVWLFATRWTAAGAFGTLVAIAGFAVALRRGLTARQAVLGSLAVTISLGNVYFWGTMNTLGDLSEPGDGLAHFLGPYYHADMLLPFAAFAAVGLLWLFPRVTSAIEWSLDRASLSVDGTKIAVATLVLFATIGGGLAVTAAAGPLGDNAGVTTQYNDAYAPFEERSLDDALVFLPTPYTDAWLNHPFQPLRNDPGYADGPVYALQRNQFDVLDAFPERTAYRYTYNGLWDPRGGTSVTPHLQRVRAVSGPTVFSDLSLSSPPGGERLLVTVAGDNGSDFVSAPLDDGTVTGTLTLRGDEAVLTFADSNESAQIPLAERDRVVVRASVDTGIGTALTYGIEVPVERSSGQLSAMTPYLEICRDGTLCGGSAAYVPGTHGDGVALNASLRADEGT